MTIYILSQDHAETARWLDDRSLDKMIKDIAQVLCNVHHMLDSGCYSCDHELEGEDCSCMEKSWFEKANPQIKFLSAKLNNEFKWCEWSLWARECRANYLWLVNLLDHLLWEQIFRFKKLHDGKYHEIFKWARDNVPYLPERVKIKQYIGAGYFGEIATDIMPPVVMPSKYHALTPYSKPEDCGSSDGGLEIDVFESYRNYYQARLNRKEPFMQFKKKAVWTLREKPEWLKLEGV